MCIRDRGTGGGRAGWLRGGGGYVGSPQTAGQADPAGAGGYGAVSYTHLLVGFLLMELYTVFNFFRVLLDKDFGKAKEPAEEGGSE